MDGMNTVFILIKYSHY